MTTDKAAAPAVGAVPQDLPPLPPEAYTSLGWVGDNKPRHYYTAAQMRAYAEAALASQAARMAELENQEVVPLESIQQAWAKLDALAELSAKWRQDAAEQEAYSRKHGTLNDAGALVKRADELDALLHGAAK